MSRANEPALDLRPMTTAEFEIWRRESVVSYAEEKTKAGHFPAQRALEMAQQSFDSLLPAGMDTPEHYFFSARLSRTDAVVGSLWLNVKPAPDSSSYIFDIVVSPAARGQGVGRALLRQAEEFARSKGARTIGLNVFGHNQIARNLYEGSGYCISSLNMRKELD